MVLSKAVESYVGVAADRRVYVTSNLARCSRCKCCQLVDAAAVYGKLRNLLAGYDAADFTRIRLYRNRVGLHRYGFRRSSDFHLEVDAEAVADLDEHVFLF